MKVLFVSSGKKNGIPGPIVKAQAESVKSKGHQVIHFTVNQKGFFGYLREVGRLKKDLKKDNIDIIHAHYGLTALVSLLAKGKQKLVVSFMGDDLVGSRKKNGNITKLSLLLAWLNAFMAKWFYDFTIVKSHQMAEKLLHSTKFDVIPNGVNTKLFRPSDKLEARKKLGLGIDKKIVIFVSKPERAEKNFNLARDAVEKLNNPNVQLLPVHGISHTELVDYYNAADTIVLSSFHEGSPNVIKEAMACNCPIVCTNVGDVERIIGNTKGCFIATLHVEDFSQSINRAIKFSESFHRTEGRQRILELSLDDQSVAERLISIYNMVLTSTK